jgi:flagellar export protein FliJ
MNTFRFRLQKVLDLRKTAEQESAARVANARQAADDAHRTLAALDEVRTAGFAEKGRGSQAPRSAGELQHLSFILEQIGEHLAVADDASRNADERVDELVTEFTDAVRQRRVLDQLRDRHRDVWQVAQVQADRKLMDELAITRHNDAQMPGLRKRTP